MKTNVLKTTFLAVALGGIAISLSSCAGGGKTKGYSADGVAFGPDGKPVAFKSGVPVTTRSNQFEPDIPAGGGGGGRG